MDGSKLVFQTTLDELIEAMRVGFGLGVNNEPEQYDSEVPRKHFVYGMKGLAKLLGCSLSTANRIKKSGVLSSAISQNGKVIVVDADLALDLLKVHNRRR